MGGGAKKPGSGAGLKGRLIAQFRRSKTVAIP